MADEWKGLSLTAREVLLWIGSHGKHPFPLADKAWLQEYVDELAVDGFIAWSGVAEVGSYGRPKHVELTPKGVAAFDALNKIDATRWSGDA